MFALDCLRLRFAAAHRSYGGRCRRSGVDFDFFLGGNCSQPVGASQSRQSARSIPAGKAAELRNIRSCRANVNPKDGR